MRKLGDRPTAQLERRPVSASLKPIGRSERRGRPVATAVQQSSPAVSVALAHIEAWSNHDFDAAREALAPNVHVTVTSTIEHMPKTDTSGAEEYMAGLTTFAETVVPGSARIDGSIGDERNALVLVTVRTEGPPMGSMTVPAARLYLLDENNKIKAEQVIFYAVPA